MNERVFRPGGLELTLLGAQAAALDSASRVLDIGCGAGATLAFLRSRFGAEVYGVDISATAAEKAQALAPEAHVAVADAGALPYPDGFFHAAFMECTLTLFPDPPRALAQAFRVLAPGGTLIVGALSAKAGGADLVENGLLSPPLFVDLLTKLGFAHISAADRSDCLVQLYADIIFNFESVADYLKYAGEQLGGAVVSCETPLHKCGYYFFTAHKPEAA